MHPIWIACKQSRSSLLRLTSQCQGAELGNYWHSIGPIMSGFVVVVAVVSSAAAGLRRTRGRRRRRPRVYERRTTKVRLKSGSPFLPARDAVKPKRESHYYQAFPASNTHVWVVVGPRCTSSKRHQIRSDDADQRRNRLFDSILTSPLGCRWSNWLPVESHLADGIFVLSNF